MKDITKSNNVSIAAKKRVIHDKDHSKGRITISETIDKSKAYMSITPSPSGEIYSKDDIITIVKNLGITQGIKDKEIEIALSLLKKEYCTTDSLLIAEGQSPVHGKDGEYEILFDQEHPFVEKNQLLVRIIDATSGEEGKDIYGKSIKPTPGKMSQVTPGTNVFKGQDNEFSSEVFGKATFNNNILSVNKILEVKVSDDRMEATLTCMEKINLTHENIKTELYSKNITYGIDNQAIDFVVSSINSNGEPIKNFLVASGKPCKEGRDGEIKIFFEINEIPCYKEQKDGSIDIRETNIVQTIKEGDELALLIPHVDPIPGKDVYGRIISAQKVKKVSLKPGKNVRVSEDGVHFFAETSGRPLFEGDKISVNEVLSIPGDLDLSVGNIDFDGIVEIDGNVEDGFKVKASKTITIRGFVGACELEAGLDIQINGGCNGKEQSNIICGRNLEAKYLNENKVISRGNITVRNEIVNSNLLSLGRVVVKSGSIRGGKIIAKKGIESYDIGSDMGVKTVLFPGEDFELNEKCKKIDECIIKINNEMEEINQMLAPLLKNKDLLSKLPEQQRDKLKETINHIKKLREEKDSLNNTKNKLITQSMQNALPEVVVYHYIFQGALLKIGKSRREIASKLEGPLRLYEENERVTVEPYSEKAREEVEKKNEKN